MKNKLYDIDVTQAMFLLSQLKDKNDEIRKLHQHFMVLFRDLDKMSNEEHHMFKMMFGEEYYNMATKYLIDTKVIKVRYKTPIGFHRWYFYRSTSKKTLGLKIKYDRQKYSNMSLTLSNAIFCKVHNIDDNAQYEKYKQRNDVLHFEFDIGDVFITSKEEENCIEITHKIHVCVCIYIYV